MQADRYKIFLCWGRLLCIGSFLACGALSAREIHFSDGDHTHDYDLAVSENAFRDVATGEVALVEGIIPSQLSSGSIMARNSSIQHLPVFYPVDQSRTVSSRRYGTRNLMISMKGDEPPAMAWFRPAPLKLSSIEINDLNTKGLWVAEFATACDCLAAYERFEAADFVDFIHPVLAKEVTHRLIPNDPGFPQQVHLRTTVPGNFDINVASVWDSFRGNGITIGVIDNGINYLHPDLRLRTDIDVNYVGGDPNNGALNDFTHGTAVAGVSSAIGNNNLGVAGVAYESSVVSIRLTGGVQTDDQEAAAFTHQNNQIFLKNSSWGPTDDGFTLEGPGPLGLAALASAAQNGRNGKGTLMFWAAGNGGSNDDVNKDGYANSIYTIAIGASDLNGTRAGFSEASTALLCLTPVGGGVLTANGSNTYVAVGGTSAASPIATGVAALMLQAAPQLGWRDVQDILIRTARKVDSGNPGWLTNGAGLKFNRFYGAGLIDAAAAVSLAQDSSRALLPAQQSLVSNQPSLNQPIPDGNSNGVQWNFPIPASNFRTEHVTVTASIQHASRGQVQIELVSPAGTISPLITVHADTNDHYINWTFMSLFHWGENPNGNWIIRVKDPVAGTSGIVNSLKLTVFGSVSGGSIPPPSPPPAPPPPPTTPDPVVVSQSFSYAQALAGVLVSAESHITINASVAVPSANRVNYHHLLKLNPAGQITWDFLPPQSALLTLSGLKSGNRFKLIVIDPYQEDWSFRIAPSTTQASVLAGYEIIRANQNRAPVGNISFLPLPVNAASASPNVTFSPDSSSVQRHLILPVYQNELQFQYPWFIRNYSKYYRTRFGSNNP